VLTPLHLTEMISQRDLRRAQWRARLSGQAGLAMANFFAHSLLPDEQQTIFGEAPWLFRRVILPRVSRGRFRSIEPFAWAPELRL